MIRRDLKDVEINEDEWYKEAVESRAGWRATCKLGVKLLTMRQTSQRQAAARDVEYDVCKRKFRRESDYFRSQEVYFLGAEVGFAPHPQKNCRRK